MRPDCSAFEFSCEFAQSGVSVAGSIHLLPFQLCFTSAQGAELTVGFAELKSFHKYGEYPVDECLIVLTEAEDYRFSSFGGERDFVCTILRSFLSHCAELSEDAEAGAGYDFSRDVNTPKTNWATSLVKNLRDEPLVDCPRQLPQLKLPSDEVLLAMFSCAFIDHALCVEGAMCVCERFFYFMPRKGSCNKVLHFTDIEAVLCEFFDGTSMMIKLHDERSYAFTTFKSKNCLRVMHSIWLLKNPDSKVRTRRRLRSSSSLQGSLQEANEEMQKSQFSLWMKLGNRGTSSKVAPLRHKIARHKLVCSVKEAVELLLFAHGESSFMTKLREMHGMHVVSTSRWSAQGRCASGLRRMLTLCLGTQGDDSNNILETHHLLWHDHGRSVAFDIKQEFRQSHSASFTVCHRWFFFLVQKILDALRRPL